MPQFDMILLTPAQAEGADVVEHTAGSPAKVAAMRLIAADRARRSCWSTWRTTMRTA